MFKFLQAVFLRALARKNRVDVRDEEWDLTIEGYTSPIPEKLRWHSWAANEKGMTGEELLNFINNELFEALKNLDVTPQSSPQGWIVKQVFEDTYNYMKSGTLIRQVINKIEQGIDFNSSKDRHQNFLPVLEPSGNRQTGYLLDKSAH